MGLTVEQVRKSAAARDYVLSLHADQERLTDGLSVDELESAMKSAELLEDYPTDPRGSSCLLLSAAGAGPIHLVCGLTRQGRVVVITVYRPAPPKWIDERTRRPREVK